MNQQNYICIKQAKTEQSDMPRRYVPRPDAGLQAAFDAVPDGQLKTLAAAIGLSPQAVVDWTRVPPQRVIAVSEYTGVPPHVIRPDLYPPRLFSQSAA